MNIGYEGLASAIVLRAVKDYRSALERLQKHPCNQAALKIKQEVEHFFFSGWYETLTTVDPERLIERIARGLYDDSKRIPQTGLPAGPAHQQQAGSNKPIK